MIACLLSLSVGALAFWTQEVPGVEVGGVSLLSGEPLVDFRHLDADGDGFQDLLLGDTVLLQREGGFLAENAVALPPLPDPSALDVWKGRIFVRALNRLILLSYDGGAWNFDLDQEIAWPASDDLVDRALDGSVYLMDRFLSRVDEDPYPVILIPSIKGLAVYTWAGEAYAPAGVLDVFPAAVVAHLPTTTLWPASNRSISFPVRQMSCQVSFDGDIIRVLTREEERDTLRYRTRTHQISRGEGLPFDVALVSETLSPPVPEFVRPCRLNQDGILDFAGYQWNLGSATGLSAPIEETWVSLDGGESFSKHRTAVVQGFRPRCLFVDMEGDGDLDLIGEATDLFSGGPRETITQAIMRSSIDHRISLFAQEQGVIGERPAAECLARIDLDQPLIKSGLRYLRYQSGDLVDLSGDFDGDGRKDLILNARRDTLSIYLATKEGFLPKPSLELSIPANARFYCYDLNVDGRSDLLLTGGKGEDPGLGGDTKVFFSQDIDP